jgi:hypothetical protein
MASNGLLIASCTITVVLLVAFIITIVLLVKKPKHKSSSNVVESSISSSQAISSSSITVDNWPLNGKSFILENKYAKCTAQPSYLTADSTTLSVSSTASTWTFHGHPYVQGAYYLENADGLFLGQTAGEDTENTWWYAYFAANNDMILSSVYSSDLLINTSSTIVENGPTNDIVPLSRGKWLLVEAII